MVEACERNGKLWRREALKRSRCQLRTYITCDDAVVVTRLKVSSTRGKVTAEATFSFEGTFTLQIPWDLGLYYHPLLNKWPELVSLLPVRSKD